MMKADVPLAQLHSSETAGWYCRHRKKWVQWRGLLASGSTNVSWGTKLSLVVLLETSCIIIVWLNPNLLSKTMQCWSQMRSFFFFLLSILFFLSARLGRAPWTGICVDCTEGGGHSFKHGADPLVAVSCYFHSRLDALWGMIFKVSLGTHPNHLTHCMLINNYCFLSIPLLSDIIFFFLLSWHIKQWLIGANIATVVNGTT